jgi:ketosteroid isomerase-like protein
VSQENVEVVRGVYDAFARRDNAAPFAAYALDIELDFRQGGFDAPALYHGHDGVRAAFRNWLTPFRDFEFQPKETKDYGDHVLVTVSEHGIGRASGVAVDRRHYALWTLLGGKIVSLCIYLDQADALNAVGPGEWGSV